MDIRGANALELQERGIQILEDALAELDTGQSRHARGQGLLSHDHAAAGLGLGRFQFAILEPAAEKRADFVQRALHRFPAALG